MPDFTDKLFIINKEKGPTSFDVVEAFRKATRERKVGHTGTLDPLAEGVLLLCTGKATRAVEHFMNLPKTYEFEICLGIETSTLDTEGDVIRSAPVPDLDDDAIREAAEGFVGDYEMEPPIYSAIKQGGRRLYEMARAGEAPRIPSRTVKIYELEVLKIAPPLIGFRVRCSRGTYVRSLARDFGRLLGTPAHLAGLVRTAIGPFGLDRAFPSRRISEGDISELRATSLAEALQFLPGVVLKEQSGRALLNGTCPCQNDIVETIGCVDGASALRMIDTSGRLLAIGHRETEDERRRFTIVDSYRLLVSSGGLHS
ncbi:MAG: tRNA pseudouridine(55) synthase TruB [Candidatus Krumholzibacteria bacterium]